MHQVTILDYAPAYAPDFKRLNTEWIEKYFTIEEHDLEQLDHPQENIISQGGYILFAMYSNEIAGTCALIKTDPKEYELAKMGVTPLLRGKQIGKSLVIAAIEKAKTVGASRVWLESNRVLAPALSLYRNVGFVEVPITYSPYARADIRMEILL